MPAVATQQLATTADLAALGPPAAALQPVIATADANLRAASGEVLAAYAKRYNISPGVPLAQWGDFTIRLVVDIAAYRMLFHRGFNPESKIDATIVENYKNAVTLLDEIADLENKNARQDPDVIDATPAIDEMGSLAASEGGSFDEADEWARTLSPPGLPTRYP